MQRLPSSSRRQAVTARAAPAAHQQPRPAPRVAVRVLRYPDGAERKIRYPLPPPEEDLSEDVWTDGDFWGPHSLWSSATRTSPAKPQQASAPPAPPPPPPAAAAPPKPAAPQVTSFSFADLLREADALAQRVKGSYQVLHGCPWVAPRPMFVLAVSLSSFDSSQRMYTLRTRVPKERHVTDELARVLGDASLAASFELSDMQDGVVALRTREQAERFAASLVDPEHRDTAYSDVSILEMSSHELFRVAVGEARGCVVAVGFNPSPPAAPAAPAPRPSGGCSRVAPQRGEDDEEREWVPTAQQLAQQLRGPSPMA